jgi:hypothetical protein
MTDKFEPSAKAVANAIKARQIYLSKWIKDDNCGTIEEAMTEALLAAYAIDAPRIRREALEEAAKLADDHEVDVNCGEYFYGVPELAATKPQETE